jgi:hypothetical protein
MCNKSQFARQRENTFFEWMEIDSGPAEDSSDGIGRKISFKRRLKEEKEVTSPGNQTKQVSCE